MKAVMVQVPPDILEQRRKTGADQWDEVWSGVLHMVPSPDCDHQDLEGALETWLRQHWVPRSGGKAYHQINVARPGLGDWRKDYRVPDLVLLMPERAGINRNEYFDGGPDAVIEIWSLEDETYEKLPFYAEIGVREMWVVDRQTRAVELYALDEGAPARRRANAAGWVRSVLGIELRTMPDRCLGLRLVGGRSIGRVP